MKTIKSETFNVLTLVFGIPIILTWLLGRLFSVIGGWLETSGRSYEKWGNKVYRGLLND